VYTSNDDGSSVQRVSHAGGAGAFDPHWSPDASQIAYDSDQTGRSQIWLVDVDGSNVRRLTSVPPGHNAYWPAFSGDGRWVIYTDCEGDDCDGGISAVRVDGTHQHHITPNSGPSFNDASESPDGSHLAYQRWHLRGLTSAIYVSHADGTHERRLTPAWLLAFTPEWRPDGRRIAFASNIYGDRASGSIYTMVQNGTGLVRVTHPPFPSFDTEPTFSPDGNRIAFESDRLYTDGRHSLFVVNADGSGTVTPIALPWDAYTPSWGTAPAIP
jgi:TolB protein